MPKSPLTSSSTADTILVRGLSRAHFMVLLMSKGGENGIRKRVPFFFLRPAAPTATPPTAAAFALRPVYRRYRGDKTGRALGTGLPCKTTHCRHNLSLYRGGRRPRSQLAAPRRSYAASGAASFGPTPAAWLEAGASARLTPKKGTAAGRALPGGVSPRPDPALFRAILAAAAAKMRCRSPSEPSGASPPAPATRGARLFAVGSLV